MEPERREAGAGEHRVAAARPGPEAGGAAGRIQVVDPKPHTQRTLDRGLAYARVGAVDTLHGHQKPGIDGASCYGKHGGSCSGDEGQANHTLHPVESHSVNRRSR